MLNTDFPSIIEVSIFMIPIYMKLTHADNQQMDMIGSSISWMFQGDCSGVAYVKL